MKKLIALAALSVPLIASAQVANDSFEMSTQGTPDSWANWTVNGGGTWAPSILQYGVDTAFGEAVNASGVTKGSYGVYFVEDLVAQSISQTTTAAAGSYNWSITYYLPTNGLIEPRAATTATLSLGGQTVWGGPLSAPGGWFTASGTANGLAANFDVVFSFAGSGVPSKDIVLDQITVSAVPEPESFALMAAGLAALGFLARRRRA